MVRDSFASSVTQAIQLGVALLADIFFAKLFGASRTADTYFIAYSVFSLVAGVLGGVTETTFVPFWIQNRSGEKLDWLLVSRSANRILLGVSFFAGLAYLSAPLLARMLASGFQESEILAIGQLLRIFSLGLLFLGASTMLQGMLRARGCFFLAGMGISLRGIVIIFGYLCGLVAGVDSLALLLLLGLLLELLYSLALVIALLQPRFHFSLGLGDERLKAVSRQLIFPLGSRVLSEGRVLAERAFAALLPPGGVAIVVYARKLYEVCLVMSVQGVQTVSLTAFSSLHAEKDKQGLRAALEKSFALVFFAGAACTVFPALLGPNFVSLALMRGNFGAQDARETAVLFSIFLLSVPINSAARIMYNVFYARQRQGTVFWINVVTMGAVMALQWLLLERFGLLGMPLGNTIGLAAGGLYTFYLALSLEPGLVSPARLCGKAGALMGMAALCGLPLAFFREPLGLTPANLLQTAGAGAVAIIFYWILVARLQVAPIPTPVRAFRAIFPGKLPGISSR